MKRYLIAGQQLLDAVANFHVIYFLQCLDLILLFGVKCYQRQVAVGYNCLPGDIIVVRIVSFKILQQ